MWGFGPLVTERTRICCIARPRTSAAASGTARVFRVAHGGIQGDFKHSESTRPCRPSTVPAGRGTGAHVPARVPVRDASGWSVIESCRDRDGTRARGEEQAPGEERQAGVGVQGRFQGGFNFCKVSDTPATSPAAIDENAA